MKRENAILVFMVRPSTAIAGRKYQRKNARFPPNFWWKILLRACFVGIFYEWNYFFVASFFDSGDVRTSLSIMSGFWQRHWTRRVNSPSRNTQTDPKDGEHDHTTDVLWSSCLWLHRWDEIFVAAIFRHVTTKKQLLSSSTKGRRNCLEFLVIRPHFVNDNFRPTIKASLSCHAGSWLSISPELCQLVALTKIC